MRHANIGDEVYWPDRQASGHDGVGIIAGIIWDTEVYGQLWGIHKNSVMVEFVYKDALVRFFVHQADMALSWDAEDARYVLDSRIIRNNFMEMVQRTHKTIEPNIGLFAYCNHNGRSVPVWTIFKWSKANDE